MVSKSKQHKPDDPPRKRVRRKRVGDETPNPLPDGNHFVEQPEGDDNPARETDSAVT